MTPEVLLDARGLGKAYPEGDRPLDRLKEILKGRRDHEAFWALQNVDLRVARGEAVGIIGRNGSGKSTLLQLLCGIAQPSTGTAAVKGRVAALLELGAGFNPEFTGRENAWLGAALLGLDDGEIARRFAAIEAFADIGPFMDQPLRQFSSGMQARLGFAVCVHVDADLLLVDEVLAVGDAAFQQKCMRAIREFRERGALLMASHDIAAVTSICDRVIWLDRGKVRAEGAPETICRQYELATSREVNSQQPGFRMGGRASAAAGVRRHHDRQAQPKTADLVQTAVEPSGASVLSARFYSEGAVLAVAEGGEDVELRICCEATRELTCAIVAFLLRDRLGQVLFGDDTRDVGSPTQIAAGARFTTTFRFDLPHLPTGEYVLEAAVSEALGLDIRLLQRIPDAAVLTVHSHHPSAGCVNLPPVSATLVPSSGGSHAPILIGSDIDA